MGFAPLSRRTLYFWGMTRRLRTPLLALLLAAGALFADSGEKAGGDGFYSHSLGTRGIWTPSGLHATLSGGRFSRSECDGAFSQAGVDLAYMYRPWLAGHGEATISGGLDDDGNTYAFNRFAFAADFFKTRRTWIVYGGPVVSVNQGNDWVWDVENEATQSGSCVDLGEGSAGVGLEVGAAFRLSRFFELSFFALAEENYPLDFHLQLATAFAWELTASAPSLRGTVSAVWLFGGVEWAWRRDGGEGGPTLGASIGF